LASYDCALKLAADDAETHCNRGLALNALRRLNEALQSFERALKLKPSYADAHHSRGSVLRELGRLDEAVLAYDQALCAKPDYAEAYYLRGITLRELGRLEEALSSYERLLAFNPNHVEALYNRGLIQQGSGRLEEALNSYERALSIDLEHKWLRGVRLHARMQLCDWASVVEETRDLTSRIERSKKATTPFVMLSLTDSPSLHRTVAQDWVEDRHAGKDDLGAFSERTRGQKIRIGYYSADYHNHATAFLMAELFERHDRTRFDIVAFSYGPDHQDAMRHRLVSAFDEFIDVCAKSDREIAQLSRDMQIDIAVDLKGFTQDSRTGIFSYRVAPVQVNYLGYPGTMGADYIDYIVADETVIPADSRAYYSEKVVYLPGSYQVNDSTRQIPDRNFTRAELGLPEQGFVYCCFNNSYKITPETFDGWMRILKQVPESVLWLLADNATAAQNLQREAQARGVDAQRLVFARRLPLPEHLARHRVADLFIDTLPYNAHTTASDALWAGLPVLTLAGKSFAARVAASLLNALELPELVTTTQDQYESLAVELARAPGRLAELRQRLQERRITSPLFDTTGTARHLENAYQKMYERHLAGLPPEHIWVVEQPRPADPLVCHLITVE
jgi:protein O-GlcNAc transferase